MQVFTAALTVFVMARYSVHEFRIERAAQDTPLACLTEKLHRLDKDAAIGRSFWLLAVVFALIGLWVPWRLSTETMLLRYQPGIVVAGILGLALLMFGAVLAQRYRLRRDERDARLIADLLSRSC